MGETSLFFGKPGQDLDLVGKRSVGGVPEVDAVGHGNLFVQQDVVAGDSARGLLAPKVGGMSIDRVSIVREGLHDFAYFQVANLNILARRRPFGQELAIG